MVPRSATPQTMAIDEEIVRLSGKSHPRMLFIPTASLDDAAYCERFRSHFGERLACRTQELLLYRDKLTRAEIKSKILGTDIIYVGGGNTLRMMNLWRKLGIDKMLNQARKKGVVLSGLSAGSICWFRQGNSDSRKFADQSNKTLIKVRGLDFVDTLICPHYDVEKHRQAALKTMMSRTRGIAIALQNCSAIEIVDNSYRILTSLKNKNAWKVYWHRGRYFKEKLIKNSGFMPLSELMTKS